MNLLSFISLTKVDWTIFPHRRQTWLRYSSSLLASLKTVFVDKPENVLGLLKIVKQVPTLKRLVLTKKIPDDQATEIQNKAKDLNIEVLTFNQLRVSSWRKNLRFWFDWFTSRSWADRNRVHIMWVTPAIRRTRRSESPFQPPKSDDLFEICYTSGTTGLPKGAMLTNKNIVCLCQSATEFFVNASDRSRGISFWLSALSATFICRFGNVDFLFTVGPLLRTNCWSNQTISLSTADDVRIHFL